MIRRVRRTIDDFIQAQLPKLLASKDGLSAIFSVCDKGQEQEPEEIPSGRDGLTISVHGNGIRKADLAELFRAVVSNSHTAHQAPPSMLETGPRAAIPCLAFVYYGQGAGARPLETALKLHREQRATVVLVSCECDEERKQCLALPFIDSGEISELIFSRSCGGIMELRIILEALIGLWPQRSHAVA